MLEETSLEARTIFLLKFTKEIISNSKGTELYRLEEIIRKRVGLPSLFREVIPKERIDERVKEVLSKKPNEIEHPRENQRKIMPISQNEQKISLSVPRPRFQDSNYLNPPSAPEVINFGKIEILTKDSNVKLIEFRENSKIIVEGNMGRKFTGIELTQEEAKNLLDEFSNNAKIPLNNGLNKIAIGNFLVTAIISGEKINSLLIKKNFINQLGNLMPPRPMY